MLNTAIKSRKEQVWDAFHDKKLKKKKKGMGMMRQCDHGCLLESDKYLVNECVLQIIC